MHGTSILRGKREQAPTEYEKAVHKEVKREEISPDTVQGNRFIEMIVVLTVKVRNTSREEMKMLSLDTEEDLRHNLGIYPGGAGSTTEGKRRILPCFWKLRTEQG